jgi:hypothetical protein
VSWLAIGGAAALQLFAGVVRVRGWFHVIRRSCEEASHLRYRAVVIAHLGGCGWNAVLPARAGDAVKVALLRRRLPDAPLATVACTLVVPALADAALTLGLVAALVAAGVLSLGELASPLPGAAQVPVIAVAACLAAIVGVFSRRHVRRLAHNVRVGLSAIGRPRFVATHVLPWQVVARGLRLLAFALVLVAAGLPWGVVPALVLMALQGAGPSMTPAATAVRIAIFAGVFAGAEGVAPAHIAAVLVASYVANSVTNLAASAAVTAWELRTVSPRRIVGYARSAIRVPAPQPRPTGRFG